MIVCIITNNQTGQAQISFEGAQHPGQVRDLLDLFAEQIEEQLPPEMKRKPKSGLILPPSSVPPIDIKKLNGDG